MADFTPQDAEKLKRSFEELERTMRRGGDFFTKMLEAAGVKVKGIGDAISEVSDDAEEALVDIGEAAGDTVDVLQSRFQALDQDLRSWSENTKKEFQALERTPFFKAVFGDPTGPGAISGAYGGLGKAMTELRRDVFGGTAFGTMGGIVGLLVEGGTQKATFEANAAKAIATFDQVGNGIRHHVKELADLSQGTRADLFTTSEDFARAFEPMAKASIEGDEAFGVFDNRVKGFGRTVADATIVYDRLYHTGSGFAAQAAAQIAEDTGKAFKDAVVDVAKMEETAKGARVNVSMFVGNILQATSALRLHRQETDDVVKVYGAMADAVEKAFPGADKSFITKTAMGHLQGLSGAIQGASQPMMALLGQQMFGSKDPFENIYRFQTAIKDKDDKAFITGVIPAIQNMLSRVQASDYAKGSLLQQQLGVGADMGYLLTQIAKFSEGGATKEQVMAKYGKDIEEARAREAQAKSPWEMLANEIKVAIGNLGRLLIDMLVSIYRVLEGGFNSLVTLNPKYMIDATSTARGALSRDVELLGKSAKGLKAAGLDAITSLVGEPTQELEVPEPVRNVGLGISADLKEKRKAAKSDWRKLVDLSPGLLPIAEMESSGDYALEVVLKWVDKRLGATTEADPTRR